MNIKKYGQWQELINYFLEKNNKINLSSIRTASGVYKKHILDSLELIHILDSKNSKTLKKIFYKKDTKLMDLGTGGGFPLLPLAIQYPNIQCFGLDARHKKVNAVNDVINQLGLNNTRVLRGRAENHKRKYNVLTVRAVAYADKIFHWSLPLLEKGGYFVLYKLFTYDENEKILTLVKKNNLTLINIHHYKLFNDYIERVIYIIQK